LRLRSREKLWKKRKTGRKKKAGQEPTHQINTSTDEEAREVVRAVGSVEEQFEFESKLSQFGIFHEMSRQLQPLPITTLKRYGLGLG